MARAVLVRGGAQLFVVLPGGRVERLGRVGPDDLLEGGGGSTSRAVEAARPRLGALAAEGPIVAGESALLRALDAAHLANASATLTELRGARAALPWPGAEELRGWAIDRARAELGRALAEPSEELVALAREEERVERALGREVSAQGELLVGSSEALQRYGASGHRLRSEIERHLSLLREELERAARHLAPNLTELLGPSLTGRLVASAGGLGRLATMSGARLQLLGTRRRPSPVRGPRFGHLFRAPRMGDVPADRRAAYARSLAALAVIAARADAITHRPIADLLVARRDRRIAELRRRR